MRTIRINGSITGVIATGSFENLRPGFLIEEIIENCQLSDEEIMARTQLLYDKTYNMLKQAESKAIVERIERERQDLRIRLHPDGYPVPSVTSVISWDIDFFVPPHELTQYASQSQIVHERVKIFIDVGKWLDPKELKDVWVDLVIVSRGSLKLEIDTGNFPNFLEKYPIEKMVNGKQFFLENTCGTPDFSGIPKGWKDAEEILTVFDVKRTPSKIKDGKQLSQYCKGVGAKQGIIVPINNKTLQGYSRPVVYTESDLAGFDRMFQADRVNFKKRFSI